MTILKNVDAVEETVEEVVVLNPELQFGEAVIKNFQEQIEALENGELSKEEELFGAPFLGLIKSLINGDRKITIKGGCSFTGVGASDKYHLRDVCGLDLVGYQNPTMVVDVPDAVINQCLELVEDETGEELPKELFKEIFEKEMTGVEFKWRDGQVPFELSV